jgi:hypothetical protein
VTRAAVSLPGCSGTETDCPIWAYLLRPPQYDFLMQSRGRLPNFLIIGAMKSGSTTLYNHLRDHPRAFLTSYKEPEFFVAEKTWSRGLAWYEGLFADAGDALAVGEASTAYTKFTEFRGVPARISSVVPDARLIYILRQPIERIRSMYEHMVLTGRERRPIDEAVVNDSMYIGPSLYAANIRRYLDYFPLEQLHVVLTDDLEQDLVGTMSRVTDFLSLPPEETFVPVPRTDLKTSERRPDRRLKTWLRDSPTAYRAFEVLPGSVRKGLRAVTSRPPSGNRPQLGADAERRLLERLEPDLADLGDILGPRFATWGLRTPQQV